MTAYVVTRPSGEIVRVGHCAAADLALQQINADETVIEGIADPVGDYVVDGAVVSKGDPPSPYHVWVWETLTWQGDVASAIAARKVEIERERERRNTLPIEYAGAAFDADALSQRNVSAWQTQIANGLAVPPGFVWRDADNIDHAADAAWINGLGAAMTERGTALYVASWAHKAAIAALPSVAAVIAYDVDSGWPA